MSRKKVIEIHTYHDEEFMDALAERFAQKLRDQMEEILFLAVASDPHDHLVRH